MEQNLSAPQSLHVGKKDKKFSLLDLLIMLSGIVVVGLFVYLIINPNKEKADLRNTHRSTDASYLLTSVIDYVNTHGDIPGEIPESDRCVSHGNEICKSSSKNCEDFVDLSFLEDENEVFEVPIDPQNLSVSGSGYYIYHNGDGKIFVCAPYAERNLEISFSKYIY